MNDHIGFLPGPLFDGQWARYPIPGSTAENNYGGQLIGFIGDYLDPEITNEDPSRASVMLCPAFLDEIEDPDARHYVVNRAIRMSDGSVKRPFGYPGSRASEREAKYPVNVYAVDQDELSWLVRDLDGISTGGYNGKPLVPYMPVHGKVRNTLFLDGHVEAVSLDGM